MKKCICRIFLVIAIVLPMLLMVNADDGYSLTYIKYSDGQHLSYVKITGYEGTLPETLVIPETIEQLPVRSISNYAFRDAPIKEVVLPGTIEELSTRAFAENKTLESVTIKEGMKVLSQAFANCSSLKNVVLPSTMQKLGYEAFRETGLESIRLPEGIKIIGESCFQFSKLKSVTLPESVEIIDKQAFYYSCAEGRLVIPASVKKLGLACFSGNNFSDVLILSENVELDGFPFDTQTLVYAHESVWENSDYAGLPGHSAISFEELPYDVRTQPTYTEGAIQYTTVDGKAYIISCDAGGMLTVPDTLGGCPVKVLQPNAFIRASGLTKLVLPDSIEEIGRNCFYSCSATIERLPKSLKKIGAAAFSGQVKSMTLLDGTIPEGITEIPAEAFQGTSIETLVLPAGLEKIGERAFSGTGAKSLTFLGGVSYVGDSAFYGIKAKEIVFPEGLEYLGGWALASVGTLEKLTLPSTVKEIGSLLFGYEAPENLKVYGYADTPAMDYCVNAGVEFTDLETGEPVAKIYETKVDGVIYRVNPAHGTAAIIDSVAEELDAILVLPETVDGCAVTSIESWGLTGINCCGIVLPDTLTYIADLSIDSDDMECFVSMPDNEVYVADRIINYVSYYFLPENFSLAEGCRENASEILRGQCIGFEKHKQFVDPKYLITIDDHADSQYVLAPSGVFRLDDSELTAIYLRSVYPMLSAIDGIPITRIAASCKLSCQEYILGDYVRVVEDGNFLEWNGHEEVTITEISVPACIEYLPANFKNSWGKTVIYGTTGTYAEQYARQRGCKFLDKSKTPFRDVSESAWYFPYVHEVFWRHLMNGTSETTFAPKATTSRAMVVQVLYNLSGRPSIYETPPFSDVHYDDWYFDAVTWAERCGVCFGTSETTFSPNAPVTREQLAAFLYRYAMLCGYECKTNGDLSAYQDSNRISAYARDAVSWAVGAGIINGTSATTIAPRSYATRAEIAAMLCRLLDFAEMNPLRD